MSSLRRPHVSRLEVRRLLQIHQALVALRRELLQRRRKHRFNFLQATWGEFFKTSNSRYYSSLCTALPSAHFANIFSACMAATCCELGKTFRNVAHAASLFLPQREILPFWANALNGIQALARILSDSCHDFRALAITGCRTVAFNFPSSRLSGFCPYSAHTSTAGMAAKPYEPGN